MAIDRDRPPEAVLIDWCDMFRILTNDISSVAVQTGTSELLDEVAISLENLRAGILLTQDDEVKARALSYHETLTIH